MAELSDSKVRSAKPRERPYKMFDSDVPGLHVLIRPTGSKTWRHREIINGKERIRTLGDWPALPVNHARAACRTLRADVESPSFREVAEEWLRATSPHRKPSVTAEMGRRLEMHVYPKLGHRPVHEIRAAEVMDVVEKLRKHGKYEMASRIGAQMTQIFSLACVKYELGLNPAAEVGRVRMTRPAPKHRAAATMEQLGELLAQLDSYRSRSTARALEFLILTAARTGEVRFATWDEFSDLDKPDKAVWDIPATRMKMKRPHRVFLSPEAVQILREQADGPWPRKGLVFPINGQAMSENALLNVLDRYGWKGRITVHGFRGTFSTHCNEHLKPVDVVEACLAHEERSATRRAYNHAQLEKHRRELVEWWAKQVMSRKRVASLLS